MLRYLIITNHTTGTDGAETTLAMKYNKANQLTGMANGRDKIAYTYDRNGSMVQKVLSSRSYGRLTDSYAYNALDQLTDYVGYDGYRQAFTYDANGMRQSRSEAGDANRSTLEELLRGNVAGLPEIVEPAQSQTNADVPAGLEWATTEYLYDLTQEYYQVISETTTYANGTSTTTAYAYGLERIAAYSENGVTRYVYDGRGSVAQVISAPVAGEAATSALPDISVKVQSFAYTAYGEQMGGVKVSGFTYNAEAYDAATGMLNLRARQYEPAVGRFSGKDMMRGYAMLTISIHRYLYTYNNPINWIDPDGMRPADKDEAAQFFVDKQPTPQAKKTNATRKLESYTNKLKSYTNTKNQSGQKSGPKQSKTIAQLSSDLKSAVGFANYNRELLANSSALREFQKARNEVHQSIANLHREVGRKENGVSIEEYRSLCSTTFAGMSAYDINSITMELNRKGGVEKDYAAEYNKATAENYVPNLNDASSAFSDETGDYDVSLDFGLPTVTSGTEMPEFNNPNFQTIADGEIIRFDKAIGNKEAMTNEDWQEYARLLTYLEKKGRLEYSTTTSGRIENGVLKTDCWGILKIGSLLTLTEEGMQGQTFNKIEYMANNFGRAGSLTRIPKEGSLDIEQLTYHPNTFVFINNNKNKTGYDHVYIVVENLEDKDTGEVYPIGLLGIGGSNIGLQTYDAYEWYQRNSDKEIAYGTQYKQE